MSQTIPPIPPQILNAAENNDLVIFVGAGASKLCGSPDWRGFADGVVGELRNSGILNFLAGEQLKSIPDARRTLSVAMNLAKTNRVEINYETILHPDEPKERGARLYEILKELNSIVVTTNYDKWPHKAGRSQITMGGLDDATLPDGLPRDYLDAKYYRSEHFLPYLLTEKGAVIHLHGSYKDEDSMIISMRHYMRHYADDRVIKFLNHLFTHCTVLFLGYGVAELEILEHIIRSNDPAGKNSGAEPRHFLLNPIQSHRVKENEFTESYFRDECGIRVINYEIDEKGYDQVVDVLETWAPSLKAKTPSLLDYQHQLQLFINDVPEAINRTSAIRLVLGQPGLTPFFLNSIKDPVWLDELDTNGFFAPTTMPPLVITDEPDGSRLYDAPRWPPLRYLENIAPLVDADEAERIMAILRGLTAYGSEVQFDNWRVWASCATIMSLLPLHVIQLTDMSMIELWLNTRFNADLIGHNVCTGMLPRLLESPTPGDADKALALIKKITVEQSDGEQKSLLQTHYLKDALEGYGERLGERCGEAAVGLFIRRLMGAIGTPDDDRYTYVHRKAIEEHQQDAYAGENLTSVYIDALRDAMTGFIRKDKAAAAATLASLLTSDFPSIVRVGIYIGDKHFPLLADVLEQHFKPSWLIKPEFWHEAYWLVKHNYANFPPMLKQRFLDLVQALPGDWNEEDPRTAEFKEYHRRDLLSAIAGQGDRAVDAWYQSLTQRFGAAHEHVDFQSYSSGGSVGSATPKTSDEFLTMSADQLRDFMATFTPDRSAFDGPSYRGAAGNLQEAVKASEDGFAGKFDLFANVHPAYQHGLLSGLKDRLALATSPFDWPAAMRLIATVLTNINPASAPGDQSFASVFEPTSLWVLTDVVDLLKAGFQSSSHPVPPMLQDECLTMILGLLKLSTPHDTSDVKDAVSTMINSRYGKALEASLVAALAMARGDSSGEDARRVWAALRPIYSEALDASEAGLNLEFATFGGLYCVNLHFLDATWVLTNFNRLFSLKNKAAWICAAQGFSYQNHLYPWLHALLRDGGHLYRMIYEDALKDQVQERAMQFLGLAYLHDDLESLDNTGGPPGLMARVIDDLNTDALTRLCWFFWTLRTQGPTGVAAPKIVAFWKRLDQTISASGQEHTELLSALNSLAVFLDVLDDSTTPLLLNAALHANVKFHTHTLVSELRRLSEYNAHAVSEIFDAVTNRFLPDFEQEDVVAIVEHIADYGEVETARKICNKYNEKGVTFLNPLFERIRTFKD
ncbi:hypothetical protein RugamoR57_03430 [Duganella caerulea]